MTEFPKIDKAHRWLQLPAAAAYLGVAPVTLRARIATRTGPSFHRLPGSRNRLFKTSDLDEWIVNSPVRELTLGEHARTRKLQAGNLRALERRRAKRAAEAAMASLVTPREEIRKLELASARPRARRAAKEDVTV